MSTNRIHSKGDYRHEEAYAGEAGIYPGMLLELNSSGKVLKQNTEGAPAEIAIAEEDALQGNTVDTVYTDGEIVSYMLPVKGAEVNVRLATGQTITVGEGLIADADGCVESADNAPSGTEYNILFTAMEAKTTTSATALIRARVR